MRDPTTMSNIRERMIPPVAERVEQPLLETMRAHVARADIVSFDVFDTLIVRAIARPTDAFALVKLRLLASEAALNDPHTVDAFPDLRVQAELRARDAKERDGHLHREVTLAEIYDALAALSGADAALVELLKQTELAVERDLVYANPVAKELFELARAERKTIVLCSDMYLPSAEIVTLLRRCGYEGYDTLYVSCEHACSKHAGTMFPYIAERHGVAAARILHVGDNLYGDCMMAREAGCTAMYLPPPPAAERMRMPWGGELPFYPDSVGAIVAGIRRKRELDTRRRAGPVGRAWLSRVRPAVHGLLAVARRDRARAPARQAAVPRARQHFIHKHLAAFFGVLPDELPGEYLYVSRGSLLIPSLTDFPLPRLDHLVSGQDASRRWGGTCAGSGFSLTRSSTSRGRPVSPTSTSPSPTATRACACCSGSCTTSCRAPPRSSARLLRAIWRSTSATRSASCWSTSAGSGTFKRRSSASSHGARRRRDRGPLRRRVPLRGG